MDMLSAPLCKSWPLNQELSARWPFQAISHTEFSWTTEPRALTQAVEAEGSVVEEEADVASPRWHAAEGVSTAGRQRIDAAGDQEDDQRPSEGVLPRRLHQDHRHQLPQEVPARRMRWAKWVISAHCNIPSVSVVGSLEYLYEIIKEALIDLIVPRAQRVGVRTV